jgi:hypothetical protein
VVKLDVLEGFPSMPKGEIIGMFSDKVEYACFVIDGKDQHVHQSDDGMAMERSTMRRKNGCWITHPEFPMTVRSKYR